MGKVTVKEFCRDRDWPSTSSMRWIIFNKELNGFGKCIIKFGKRVLIDEDKFDECLEEMNGKPLPTRYDSSTGHRCEEGQVNA